MSNDTTLVFLLLSLNQVNLFFLELLLHILDTFLLALKNYTEVDFLIFCGVYVL